jgi:hypothetical protein
MDCNRSGVTVYEKSEAPAVWTFDGILSGSTAPGTGFATVASAETGAGAAGAATARLEGLAGALRAGGATGVVAITWISGSFVELELPLELEASCAAPVSGATVARPIESAQSDPRSEPVMSGFVARLAKANMPDPLFLGLFY